MAFIFVGYGARGQFHVVAVDDADEYTFRRDHVGRTINAVADNLLEDAMVLGNPPILADVTTVEVGMLVRELQNRGYPRLVRSKMR